MKLVVHISADYPDAIGPAKTRAIAALVEGTAERFTHRVYSLNRSGGFDGALRPGQLTIARDDGTVASCRYAALPGGIGMTRAMKRVAVAIAADLAARGLHPALVHGHKLSFEGLAAQALARQLGVPYLLTLQGNTDQKVLQARPDLIPALRRCWQGAAHVIAFAPWIADFCAETLGARSGPVEALPCVPVSDAVLTPAPTGPLVRTAFNLDDWRNKNIATLAEACAMLTGEFPELSLEIAGRGSAASEAAVDTVLREAGIADRAKRIGPVAPQDVQHWMNGAAIFAMPSLRESFGMVFAEAVLAGCPILYPRGAAVDGYFPDASFALGVDARSAEGIAEALGLLLRENAARKAELAHWQANEAQRFTAAAILARYRAVLQGLAQ